MTQYKIHLYYENGGYGCIFGAFLNDWDAHEAVFSDDRITGLCWVLPQRLGRAQ